MERTEKEIMTDLRSAQEAYAKLASDQSSTQADLQKAVLAIKTLNAELDSFIAHGAEACECGQTPMGMLKTPGYHDEARGYDVPSVFEVGCVYCAPYLVESDSGKELNVDGKKVKVKRRSYSARATTPQEAVRKWNDKEWVEDFLFERIPNFVPEYL